MSAKDTLNDPYNQSAVEGRIARRVEPLGATLKLELPWCEASARKAGRFFYASDCSRSRVEVSLFKDCSYEGKPIAVEIESYEMDADGNDVRRGFSACIKLIGRQELQALRDMIDLALQTIADGEDA